MTVVQLKDYMRQHNIKPLGGRKSDLISRIYIYENNIKTSQQVLEKKGMSLPNYSKFTVNDLKVLLRNNGLRVSGRRQELIDRLNEYSTKTAKKSESAKFDDVYYSKMTVAILKEKLKAMKLPVGGRKGELIQRLMSATNIHKEKISMGMEDRNVSQMVAQPIPVVAKPTKSYEEIFAMIEKHRRENEELKQKALREQEALKLRLQQERIQFIAEQTRAHAEEEKRKNEMMDNMNASMTESIANLKASNIPANVRTNINRILSKFNPFTIGEQVLMRTRINYRNIKSYLTIDDITIQELQLCENILKEFGVYNFDGWTWDFVVDVDTPIKMMFRREISAGEILNQVSFKVIREYLQTLPREVDVVMFQLDKLYDGILMDQPRKYRNKPQPSMIPIDYHIQMLTDFASSGEFNATFEGGTEDDTRLDLVFTRKQMYRPDNPRTYIIKMVDKKIV